MSSVRYTAPQDAAEALRQASRRRSSIPGLPSCRPPRSELLGERARGIKVASVLDDFWKHLEIRMSTGGNPVLGKRLVRQALAYGIDRVAIARAVAELDGNPAARADRSTASSSRRTVATTGRRGNDTATGRPRRSGCSSRPAASRGSDRYRLRRSAALVPSRDGGSGRASEANGRARSGAAAKSRSRDHAAILPRALVWGASSEGADFDLFQFSFGSRSLGVARHVPLPRPGNFTGYCDRLVTSHLVQATRILDDARRTQLLHGIDARLAIAVPAIPLFQDRSLFAFDATIRRGVVFERPFAPLHLERGRTAASTTSSRGGGGGACHRLRCGRRCRNKRLARRHRRRRAPDRVALPPRSRRAPSQRLHRPSPRLSSRVREPARLHRGGSTARLASSTSRPGCSSRHDDIRPEHARATALHHLAGLVFTYRAKLAIPSKLQNYSYKTQYRGDAPSTRRPASGPLRDAPAHWRAALFPVVLPEHALRGETLGEELERLESTTRRRGRPSGAVPSSLERLAGAASSSRFDELLATGGHHPPTSTASSFKLLPPPHPLRDRRSVPHPRC